MSHSTSNQDSDVLVVARGIRKAFPGVKALDGVDISVRRGRLNALLGENGAGKSTLMNILAGVFQPEEGEIHLNGECVSFASPRDAQEAGISITFQELNLIPQLSIAENIFLGREPRNWLGLVDYDRMNRAAKALLEQLQLSVDPRAPVARLKVGAQQIVEIAKAISFEAQVLIMDEPTSALSDQEIEVLFSIIEGLKRRGVGIIYITHKLDELPRIADDVTIFRDGRLITTTSLASLTQEQMVELMVGRDISDIFSKHTHSSREVVLNVKNMSLPHPERPGDFLLRGISLEVKRGEVVGLFGLMGAGRTELLQAIFGLHPHSTSGEVFMGGRETKIESPAQAIRAGLALAPEDRKAEGLVLSMSVGANITLASLVQTSLLGFLQPLRERELVEPLTKRLRVKTPSLNQRVRNLSGGNQQKVVLAKWLATDPKILLLDEPTRGIDIQAKKEIYVLIDELAREGMGILIVSSELPEILSISDRVLVLADGELTAEFTRAEATEARVLAAALSAHRVQRARSA